ncbi:MAG: NAD kinase [Actinobacteria bacterium]|nr:NAD kinase [Actinomycetota bacterium]
MSERTVFLVVHGGRAEALEIATDAVVQLSRLGIAVVVGEADDCDARLSRAGAMVVATDSVPQAELALVFGGDGTVLRAAEAVHAEGIPLLGFNLGHVGFLAEAETDHLERVVHAIATRGYEVESRMALSVRVQRQDEESWASWALNEVSVERSSEPRVLDVGVRVDGEPLSRYGCDGIVCASATGSTAYAFSAGGPVIWPQVEAFSLVPVSAHALFSRPLIVAPTSDITVEVLSSHGAYLWADGRRGTSLGAGDMVLIRRHPVPVRFARVHDAPFTRRLVAKFQLPISGWRELRREQ